MHFVRSQRKLCGVGQIEAGAGAGRTAGAVVVVADQVQTGALRIDRTVVGAVQLRLN